MLALSFGALKRRPLSFSGVIPVLSFKGFDVGPEPFLF